MFSFAASFVLATLAASVSAQSTTATASATGATHTIVVGGSAGKVYTPNSITAAVGDVVLFEFNSVNHTVTQSAFATPCTPLVNGTETGFNSGFVPVSANATTFPAWSIQVTADTPIWFFCEQTGHCEAGMVGAINAPTNGTKTFANFQAAAIALASNTTATTGTSNTTTTTGTSSSSSSSASSSAGTSSDASGAEITISRMGFALAGLLGGVAFLL